MENNRAELCECRKIHQERIDRALENALPEETVEEAAALFKAMGDPGRVKILYALADGEMCVCDLAVLVGVSESAVSHQLRMSRQMRLVANRRQGTVLYYRLKDEGIVSLIRAGVSFCER